MHLLVSRWCFNLSRLVDDEHGRQIRPSNYNAGLMPAERIASADPLQNNHGRGRYPKVATLDSAHMDRGTSPVDRRILDEFYSDMPQDMHSYDLDGRRYLVYEGKTFGDINIFKRGTLKNRILQSVFR